MLNDLVIPTPTAPVLWRLRREPRLSEAEFLALCGANPDLRWERTAEGEIIVMAPTGGETGTRNADLTFQVRRWSKANANGRTFDSSTAFRLPNGATRSPDAAWVTEERWAGLAPDERRTFPPLCPDFVAELRSDSDRLRDLQLKLREYIANGARLGWLIDPTTRIVYVYRPGRPVERLDYPKALRGEPELPGLEVDLTEIWQPEA